MDNSSAPIDYPSFLLCLGVYIEHILIHINVSVALQWLEVGTAFAAFLYNVLKLIEWIRVKFFKTKDNAKKQFPNSDS